MKTTHCSIDFTRLFGFEDLRPSDGRAVDFRDDRLSARLGAKVGVPEPGVSPEDKPVR